MMGEWLAVFGWLSLGAFFGVIVTGLCAAASNADDITKDYINESQEKIIKKLTADYKELQTKHDKVKTELHEYWMNARDGSKYPLEGGTD